MVALSLCWPGFGLDATAQGSGAPQAQGQTILDQLLDPNTAIGNIAEMVLSALIAGLFAYAVYRIFSRLQRTRKKVRDILSMAIADLRTIETLSERGFLAKARELSRLVDWYLGDTLQRYRRRQFQRVIPSRAESEIGTARQLLEKYVGGLSDGQADALDSKQLVEVRAALLHAERIIMFGYVE